MGTLSNAQCKLLTKMMAGMSTQFIEQAEERELWGDTYPERANETVISRNTIIADGLELNYAADTLLALCDTNKIGHATAGDAVNIAKLLRSRSDEVTELAQWHDEGDDDKISSNYIMYLKGLYKDAKR